MTTATQALARVLQAQVESERPLAVVLAGHNGSGKSTLWYDRLAPELKIPLVNADRMLMSVLPEPPSGDPQQLAQWASTLRETNESWSRVAQKGVQAFVARAMGERVPFAYETVFSYWEKNKKTGRFNSKINDIRRMKRNGYFVVLVFVGLANVNLSIGRVESRKAKGGHGVPHAKLSARFPRTQRAISAALGVASASLLVDNSRTGEHAFTVCRVQIGKAAVYDIREAGEVPNEISEWLPLVSP